MYVLFFAYTLKKKIIIKVISDISDRTIVLSYVATKKYTLSIPGYSNYKINELLLDAF